MHGETLSIPLLHDRHTHPLLYAAFMDGLDLGQHRDISQEEAVARIRDHVHHGRDEWSIVYGWNSGRFLLEKSAFDDLPPLVVFNLSLHGIIVNEAGRALLEDAWPGVTNRLEDQDWIERNLRPLVNLFARRGARPEKLQAFYRWLLENHGVWAADEMLLVSPDEIRLFREAGLMERTQFWASPATFDELPSDLQGDVRGVKLFTDGALGAWTAALHVPYRNSNNRGLLLYETEELARLIKRYTQMGVPLAIHAIGDRAIDQVVAAVDSTRTSRSREIRLEHVQFISLSTARRARDLGLCLCMQPNFSDDSLSYQDRLPGDYPARNNPFRMLIDDAGFEPGVNLLLGSDGMPHGAAEALRQSLFPPFASQGLTIDEFVRGYCVADFAKGQVDVEIDAGARQVRCQVRPATDKCPAV